MTSGSSATQVPDDDEAELIGREEEEFKLPIDFIVGKDEVQSKLQL